MPQKPIVARQWPERLRTHRREPPTKLADRIALSPSARTRQHQCKRSLAIRRRTASIESAILLRSSADKPRLNLLNIAAVSLAVTRLAEAWRSSHASVSP